LHSVPETATTVVEVEKQLATARGRAIGAVVDVGRAGELTEWVDAAADAFGGIDIVISNVSAFAAADSDEAWELAFQVDLLGMVRLIRSSLPHLRRSEFPSIVNISSVSAREVDSSGAPYGAMKAALVTYTHRLAVQLASSGIRANSVSPGNTFSEDNFWGRMRRNDASSYENALARNPMGRMCTPQEVANAVVFLASPASSFTTGANLVVDGGMTRGVPL
jgi:3-oxoacyl-[acyl-carrier protein] reductase